MNPDLEAALPPTSTEGNTCISYGNPLPSRYTKLSEHIRRSAPGELQCSVFCGGARCKYESGSGWSDRDKAIQGIYSHWVTDDILAMARPSTEAILQFNILQQFTDQGIRSIFNLQLPGEHAHCGNPLEPSGFSYEPQDFMDNGVFFYNFGWKDYGTPSNPALLDMVKVMAFALGEGKVAVHCHAGLGRTGLLISCYLVYALRCRPNDAIRYVRLKRHGSVQTQAQIGCVQKFAQFLLPLFIVYPVVPAKAVDFTLSHYLLKQRQVLHGLEGRHLKYIPKILYALCERLLKLCENSSGVDANRSSSSRSTASVSAARLSFELTELEPFWTKFLCSSSLRDRWRSASEGSQSAELVSPSPEEGPQENDTVLDSLLVAGLSGLFTPTPASPECGYEEVLENEDISESQALADNACFKELSSQKELRSLARKDVTHVSSAEVGRALLLEHALLGPSFLSRLRRFQRELNSRGPAWDMLNVEQDPALLAGLLWFWLDKLKEPVLSTHHLTAVVIQPDNPVAVLLKLDRGARFTTEYLVRFVSRLQLPSSQERRSVLRRLTSALCHQALSIDGVARPVLSGWVKMREGTAARATEFMEVLYEAVAASCSTRDGSLANGQARDKSFRGINIMASAIAR
ncbi:protein tyrosine phosphatase domain-containing protein 1 [Ixodes scapularis]|uniref:protein tyrosine phosphatase domain-containing protein 1 n=1 Tax=Ixodes scapularis TaxID=6945 RepID=UPI001C38C7B2|nr:protein tyrosine phosphatase domain-containing protein 1 [Ixodes scapularis]